jgi:hypothetical protein
VAQLDLARAFHSLINPFRRISSTSIGDGAIAWREAVVVPLDLFTRVANELTGNFNIQAGQPPIPVASLRPEAARWGHDGPPTFKGVLNEFTLRARCGRIRFREGQLLRETQSRNGQLKA